MATILDSLFPIKKQDECGKVEELNCDGELKSVLPSIASYLVIYPLNGNFPIAGGAVVQLGAENYTVNESTIQIPAFSLDDFDLSEDKLSTLVRLRNKINEYLLSYPSEGTRKKFKLPKILIQSYLGDDSTLRSDEIDYPQIQKIAEFKYIPFTALQGIVSEINRKEISIIGASGVPINAVNTTLDLVLELFLIPNISSDDLLRVGGNPAFAGFCTFKDNQFYLKMPDLSGANSSGLISSDIWTGRNLYLSFLKGDYYKRLKVLLYNPPFAGNISERTFEFPTQEDLVLSVSTLNTTATAAYLSPVRLSSSIKSKPGFNIYNNAVDEYSAPLLTSIPLHGKSPTLTLTDFVFQSGTAYLNDEINGQPVGYGIPQVTNEFIIGEMNRPDLVLADKDSATLTNKNELNYFNSKTSSNRPIMASVRPKFYSDNEIPASWLVSSSIQPTSTGISITFPYAQFSSLKKDQDISFNLYIKDNANQLSKINSGDLTLTNQAPVITDIPKNGFIGSDFIDVNEPISLTIVGDNLNLTESLVISDGSSTVFNIGQGADYNLVASKEQLSLTSTKTYADYGFIGTANLSILSRSGLNSNVKNIYVNDGGTPPILSESFSIQQDEFYFPQFGGKTAYGLPVLYDGQDAKIKLKSKRGLFQYSSLKMHIAFKAKSDAEKLDLLISEITTPDGILYIPESFSWELKTAKTENFYKLSNYSAEFKFPGPFKYKNLEPFLSSLNIKLVVHTDNYASFDVLNLEKFFSHRVESIYIKNGDTKTSSRPLQKNLIDNDTYNFLEGTPTVGKLSVSSGFDKLAVVFFGTKDKIFKSDFEFYIGTKRIKPSADYLYDEQTGRVLAKFENIKIKDSGVFELVIKRNEGIFDIEYDSSVFYKGLSAKVSAEKFSKDEFGLILNESVSKIEDFVYRNTTNLADIVFENTPALADLTKLDVYSFLNENVSILPTLALRFKTGITTEEYIPGATKSINSVNRNFLEIASDYNIPSSQFLSDNSNALIFGRVRINGGPSIYANVPEILHLSQGAGVNLLSTPNPNIQAGATYNIQIKNSKDNFVFKINNRIIKPKDIKKVGDITKCTLTTPPDLVIIPNFCIELCPSLTNIDRNRGKLNLGRDFAVNLTDRFNSLVYDNLKDRLLDYEELKKEIERFPLRLASLKLDKVSIPQEAINSFCDMSFHLTADLKIALNGFQLLMVPVQIIFCIIDVICSLLNPIKIAKSVVRLFQCLYDLVLLLPQISIPVMFLQLIFHLLRLLECIIDKVRTTIIAINAIITAIALAMQKKDWDSLRALEEVLSEYLYDVNIQLSVLDPITSILAIFLDLLNLAFRFPCKISEDSNDPSCGLDGTILSGIILGKLYLNETQIDASKLLPIAQKYSTELEENAINSSNGSAPYKEPEAGDVVARKTSSTTFYDSFSPDINTLRGTYSSDYNASFAASITKSVKGFGNPTKVKFVFNSKGENGIFIPNKVVNSEQNIDSRVKLLVRDFNEIRVPSGKGNLISPIDAYEFLNFSGDFAEPKPLAISFDVPTYDEDENGNQIETGTEVVSRTFDDIPSVCIVDEEGSVYFIEPNGITFIDDEIKSITAKVINKNSVSKLRFIREDEEFDSDDDGTNDTEAPVFDFPQIYFFDMRSVSEQIQEACFASSLNNFLLEEDPDDIKEVVEYANNCLGEFLREVRSDIDTARQSMLSGKVPNKLDVARFDSLAQNLQTCVTNAGDDICIYTINSLNSSFRLEDDISQNTNAEFPDVDILEETLEGFESTAPALTGAREYASGIGDSITIPKNRGARIAVIPRDSYDETINGDLSSKIKLEIVSDNTQSARFVLYNNSFVYLDGDVYYGELVSDGIGEVKIKASICSKTIQAITYRGLSGDSTVSTEEVDCVTPAAQNSNEPVQAGALTKIDRILSVFFTEVSSSIASNLNADDATTNPQVLGTSMEN